jgi:Tol biopolymer transport system component
VLASCAYDGTIRLWDTSTGKELRVLRGHRHKVTSVAFSPDGTILASGGFVPFETESFKGSTQGDQVRLWDPESGKELRRLPVKGQRVAIAPDGKTLIASAMYLDLAPAGQGGLVFGNMSFDGGSRITVWDMQRNRERYRLDEYWTGLAISADGRYLASSWGSRLHGGGTVLTHQSKSKGVHVWELETGKEMLAFTAPEGTGTVLAFAPDARRLIAGCQDGKLRIWDLNAQREKK